MRTRPTLAPVMPFVGFTAEVVKDGKVFSGGSANRAPYSEAIMKTGRSGWERASLEASLVSKGL